MSKLRKQKIELGRILADIELTKLSCGMEKSIQLKKDTTKSIHPFILEGF